MTVNGIITNISVPREYGTLGIMGCDPGRNGGIAIIGMDGEPWQGVPMPDTDEELLAHLRHWAPSVKIAYLELVHSFPHDGPVQAHRFGLEVGRLRMALKACGILFDTVDPRVWQASMKCMTRGKKAVSRKKAKELFPQYCLNITDKTADALLIAEHGRRLIVDAHAQKERRMGK